MKYHIFHKRTRLQKPSTYVVIMVKCNSTCSNLLGEGIEDNILYVEETRINMSFTKSPKANTSLYFGGLVSVANAVISSGTQLLINYEPTQGTYVNINIDVGATAYYTKVTFGLSKVMSNWTFIAVNITASASESMPPGIYFMSHRYMIKKKYQVHGLWVLLCISFNYSMDYYHLPWIIQINPNICPNIM